MVTLHGMGHAICPTWADAEWAAMQHVFCASGSEMPYSAKDTGTWSGWTKYDVGMPRGSVSGWSFWGEWRLVGIGGKRVLLWKSNTHLDFPGQAELVAMVQMLIAGGEAGAGAVDWDGGRGDGGRPCGDGAGGECGYAV